MGVEAFMKARKNLRLFFDMFISYKKTFALNIRQK